MKKQSDVGSNYIYVEDIRKMESIIRPFFITPLVYNDKDVNGVINTALIEALPDDFDPVVLGSIYSVNKGRSTLLKANVDIFVRAFFKLGPQILTHTIRDLPDKSYYQWYLYALRKGRKYLNNGTVSYLHSISVPYSAHLVALKLKKEYNLPWIAQFYEPWANNSYRIPKLWVWRRNEVWERTVAEHADLIIHNSDEMVNSWMKRYGAIVENKIVSLPMSFNFDRFQKLQTNKHDSNKLQICHIGHLYRLRRADAFLCALSSLFEETPEYRNKIEISFVGRMDQEDLNLIDELQLQDNVKVLGSLSELECINYYEKADLFLVIESPKQGKLFFPSKLIRYYYYGKPIIGLTCEGSVLYNQLNKNGHFAFTPNDIDGIKNYLIRAINNYSSLLDINKDAWREFEARDVAMNYSNLLLSNRII